MTAPLGGRQTGVFVNIKIKRAKSERSALQFAALLMGIALLSAGAESLIAIKQAQNGIRTKTEVAAAEVRVQEATTKLEAIDREIVKLDANISNADAATSKATVLDWKIRLGTLANAKKTLSQQIAPKPAPAKLVHWYDNAIYHVVLGVFIFLGVATWSSVYLRYGILSPGQVVSRLEKLRGDIATLEEQESAEQAELARKPPPASATGGAPQPRSEMLADKLVARIEAEIDQQGNRANVNLVIGGCAAAVAVGLLLVSGLGTQFGFGSQHVRTLCDTTGLLGVKWQVLAAQQALEASQTATPVGTSEVASTSNETLIKKAIETSPKLVTLRTEVSALKDQVSALIDYKEIEPTTFEKFIFGYSALSRLLLSVTSSVFAFFFLSTYRRNLSEIRYFHNELTNVQARLLVLESLKAPLEAGVRSDILKAISETERNFVLAKGQTTVDLMQKSFDQEETSAYLKIIDKMADILAKFEPPPKAKAKAKAAPA